MRHVLVLAVASAFVVGSFVGWRLPRPAARPAGTDSAARTGLDGIAPAMELEAPQVAAPPRAFARTAVESEVTPAPTSLHEREAPAPAHERPPELSRDVRELLRSAELEAYFAERPREALHMLVVSHLQMGRPDLALEALRSHPSEETELYERVAAALEEAGDPASAVLAYELLLEARPFDPGSLASLSALDPSAALAMIERKSAELGPLYAGRTEAERARALFALGRSDEARAALEALLAADAHDGSAWNVLAQVDPALAERRMRELAAVDAGTWPSMQIALLLQRDADRAPEAAAVLEELLRRYPGEPEALDLLSTIDPMRAFEHVSPGSLELLDPWTLSDLAGELWTQGRQEDAVLAWLNCLARDTESPAAEHMAEVAPERLMQFFETISANSNDDEQLGDIADAWWRQGHRERAIELWNRAHRIDPADGEWIEKLQAVLAGEEPF